MRRLLVLVALLGLAVAAPAAALPGDAPIEPLAPAEGATVAPDDVGIVVTFTCPAYRDVEDPLVGTIPGGPESYTATLADDPRTTADGRLATTVGLGAVVERTSEPGVCDAQLGSGGFPRPQATPGTHYWQVYRNCGGCTGGVEVGPVRSFVIRSTVKPTLAAPKVAYAGYPFLVTIGTQGVGATRADDVVQRKAGGRWRTIARQVAGYGPLLQLPKGRQRLRAVSTVGADTLISAERVVTIRRARRWSTSRRDDGAYRDPQRSSVRFTVTGGGRRITGFTAEIPLTCPGPNTATLELPPIRIAPDGRFALDADQGGIRRRIVGRLRKGRLRNTTARYVGGSCAGSITVGARKR